MNKVFRVELSGGNGCYCELELPAAPYISMEEVMNGSQSSHMEMGGIM